MTTYSAHNSWTNRRIAYSRRVKSGRARSENDPSGFPTQQTSLIRSGTFDFVPSGQWSTTWFLLHGPGEYVSFLVLTSRISAEEAGGIPNNETPRVHIASRRLSGRSPSTRSRRRADSQGASPGPFAYCVVAFRHELREYRRAEGQTIDLRRSRRKLMLGIR